LESDVEQPLLVLRQPAEADALLAQTARTLARPTAIVSPGTAFLALLSAGLQGHPPAGPLGRLKTLLTGPALPRAQGIPHTWKIANLLPDLLTGLPPDWHDLLPALLAAIDDPAQVPALDRFPLWRDTPPVVLDPQ
jgi:hypothetical protein